MGLNLITLSEYKAHQGISSINSDVELNSLIVSVSEFVKNTCRRTFVDWVSEPKIEVFSGGHQQLVLGESPIINILDVEKSEDYGQNWASMTQYSSWVLDEETGCIACTEPGGLFKKQINGYRVTYNAGYEVLPQDLKLAVIETVTYYLKYNGAVHNQISVSSTHPQMQYIALVNLPTNIRRILDLYTQRLD